MNSITPIIFSAATTSWTLLNSNIAIAVIGGFAGAIGGALGAQKIVENSKKREERIRELRYTNAAIMVAHTICNTALSLKKQHVQPMREAFLQSKKSLKEFQEQKNFKQIDMDANFYMQMDLRSYPAPVLPIETLRHIVFQEISTVGRPLALVAVIEQSLIGLTAAIAKRDQLIQSFISGKISKYHYHHYYFGLPLPGGVLNQEYPDVVEIIYSYVDDLAFFGYQLCKDLILHGARVRERINKKPSKQLPNVSEADFSGPLKSGLLPPESQYADWVKAVVERPE